MRAEPVQIALVAETYEVDSIGQRIPVRTETVIFGEKEGITQKEFAAVGQHGLRAEMKITVHSAEYNGEETVRYGDVLYNVYRTYPNGNRLELYLTRETGKHTAVTQNGGGENGA